MESLQMNNKKNEMSKVNKSDNLSKHYFKFGFNVVYHPLG